MDCLPSSKTAGRQSHFLKFKDNKKHTEDNKSDISSIFNTFTEDHQRRKTEELSAFISLENLFLEFIVAFKPLELILPLLLSFLAD